MGMFMWRMLKLLLNIDVLLIYLVIFQTCLPYWPEEINSKKTYEEIEVELLATDIDSTFDFIVRRDFRVKEIKQKVINYHIWNN